jgi:hypothetical protein
MLLPALWPQQNSTSRRRDRARAAGLNRVSEHDLAAMGQGSHSQQFSVPRPRASAGTRSIRGVRDRVSAGLWRRCRLGGDNR